MRSAATAALVILAAGLPSMATATTPCESYFTGPGHSLIAKAWCLSGDYETFTYEGVTTDIFYRCSGSGSPAIFLQHGWPTSSIDFMELMDELDDDHLVCTADMPGHGFSDKPTSDTYSIAKDAALLDYLLGELLPDEDIVLLTHDRGSSVGLKFIETYNNVLEASGDPGYEIIHQFITNGSIWLAEAEISGLQTSLLASDDLEDDLTPGVFAAAMDTQYYDELAALDQNALAETFEYEDQQWTLHETIQYLNERALWEHHWICELRESVVPATLAWAQDDEIAVPDVGDFVWREVDDRTSASIDYYQVPEAAHYIQYDRADALVQIIDVTLNSGSFSGMDTPIEQTPAPGTPTLTCPAPTPTPTP